jgi:methylated-DNA-protein-cysteine methyltransferase-like protein
MTLYNILMKSFTDKVYALAKQIPSGKVATYGQLAKLAGSPKAARAVGMCMKHNPDMNTIPCHRVVASDGKLTGYAYGDGIATKKELLLKEGVSFVNGKVDLRVSRWTASSEQLPSLL